MALNSQLTMKFGKSRTVQELCTEIAFRTGVPERHFYLLLNGRMLSNSSLLDSAGVETDAQIVMCGRLNGGGRTVIVGEWDCQKCGMQGCWPTKHKCFGAATRDLLVANSSSRKGNATSWGVPSSFRHGLIKPIGGLDRPHRLLR